MLYDRLDNLEQYTGLFDNLDTCLEWMTEHDWKKLPLGRTEIDEDRVFVSVVEVEPGAADATDFETHTRYMDLQAVIDGSQLFQISLGGLTEKVPYNAEKDIAFYDAPTSCAGILDEDRFVVFMVEEPHKPLIAAEGCTRVKKAIFKIER